jgi:rhodanese-related sulfurtransferase
VPSQVFAAAEVMQLLAEGAQLVDVLDEDDFEHDHLPRAVNIPLKQVDAEHVGKLDRNRPVIVYCNDYG